ncbi:MAG: Crp/Fnr family transcriptional regulator [Clostridiales Family XIII bacterium]|jgi:CRP-like cAMP-binding protein|nr:Crp/Fnr family transcriptional regulator [Clostridiales Family XIII bacterium]
MNAKILRTSKLFKDFTDEEILHITRSVNMWRQRFGKNEFLTHQGQSVRNIGILTAGNLVEEKYHFDGRKQIIRVLTPHFIVKLESVTSSIRTSPTSIIANQAGSVLWMGYDDLIRSGPSSPKMAAKLSAHIARIISDESIKLMYKSDILSIRTVRGRVLAYLSIVSERRSDQTVSIGMNQEEFAHYLCVDRTSLSHELNLMRKEGVIDFKGKTYTIPPGVIESSQIGG